MFPISHQGKWFRFLMVFIFLAASMETDIYLPTFPDILKDLNTSAVMVQRILSYNFIGICIGSLIYGPLSDHFGRRPIMMFGFSIFLGSSIGCVFAQTIEQLLAFRLLQGFGSSACLIVGTTMIFDFFEEESAAKLVADLNTLTVSIMAFAPLIGGWISIHMGYHANFVFIAVLVLISAVKCFLFIPESLPSNKRKRLIPKRVVSDYRLMLSSYDFWYNTLVTSFILAGYMVFVSNMSLLYVDHLKVESEYFPLYQMATLGTFAFFSLINGRLIDRFGIEKLKSTGLGLMFLATTIFWLVPTALLNSPSFLTITMCLFSVGAALSIGLFFSESMQVFPDMTGVAASLVTSIRLIIVAIAIDVASSFYNGSSQSVVYAVTVAVVAIAIVALFHSARKLKHSKLNNNVKA
ncbi:Bcr/CflA family drug resistance efflux transporter [Vibrio zhanjiangensis]|uniref:Bcr/CflA family efflux transporter n=2 Tax=Vibrio zhanjiangensis TaxID=1046128 RepID=A0ABQ6EZL5_9VIBR|nr:multidrug effflux MFS transporter [Vibrio zhanjiangensis]GLT18404.1 Bcr/CflA family drug resistance efflux transporter [Vibrio zhanjiangensis]